MLHLTPRTTVPQHPSPPGPPAPLLARGPPNKLTSCLEPPRALWTTTPDPTHHRPPASHSCLSCSSPQSCRGFPGLVAHRLSSLRENKLKKVRHTVFAAESSTSRTGALRGAQRASVWRIVLVPHSCQDECTPGRWMEEGGVGGLAGVAPQKPAWSWVTEESL